MRSSWIEQAYLFDWSVGADSADHLFCGRPASPSAVCPNCALPLQRLLSLDCADPRLGLEADMPPRLELLYCWECGLAQAPFFYRVLEDGSIQIVSHGEGPRETDFPYEDYPRWFPEARLRLSPLPRQLDQELREYERLRNADPEKLWEMDTSEIESPRHQIGGVPFLYDDSEMVCPDCGQPMPFFATVADACLDERGITGNDGVQTVFGLCRGCKIVGARQECD